MPDQSWPKAIQDEWLLPPLWKRSYSLSMGLGASGKFKLSFCSSQIDSSARVDSDTSRDTANTAGPKCCSLIATPPSTDNVMETEHSPYEPRHRGDGRLRYQIKRQQLPARELPIKAIFHNYLSYQVIMFNVDLV
jgi:hypothetical protein